MALEHGMIEPFVDVQVREGIISYGLTSYGYDMRVTNQFKVFTNVFNVLVDPKHFNPRSFVDIESDHIDIPPNSFALAQSFEQFKIPRNVSCIVIGKSTYARCFRGDTRVALVDGTAPTLEEMARRADDGEIFWGYSIGPNGRIMVTLLEAPRYIGTDSLLEITLDNEEKINCTPDHVFLLRNGQESTADQLRPGDSLMPLYRDLYRGYEMVYQPLDGSLTPIHRLADEWNLRHAIDSDEPGTHCYHKDMHTHKHKSAHIEHIETPSATIQVAYDRLMADPAWPERANGQPEQRQPHSGQSREMWMRNHKVAAVRSLPGTHDVYCLTVPEAGNFALAAGVFTHNCGIIINVTPLEPEWQGYVTIEISNTTPLPARIYANEGIGQVLFFEGDEPCETSYADKKGKYQGQVGIVLPRIDREL
ncbi:MAG: dCTP deaminase [Oscillochloris sp.]|nr:dCTP deaminase [Oscillochloris sp.]